MNCSWFGAPGGNPNLEGIRFQDNLNIKLITSLTAQLIEEKHLPLSLQSHAHVVQVSG